jgi:hypothetical protein
VKSTVLTEILAALGLTSILAGVAVADVVTPIAPNGTLLLGFSTTAAGANSGAPATVTGNSGTSSLPVHVNDLTTNPASNYAFSNSFALPANASFSGTIQGYNYNFDDSYIIDVPNSMASAYIFSLNLTQQLGVQDLSARLYSYSAGTYQNFVLGGTGSVNGPVAGAWSPDQNGVVASTLINADVASGEYVLQIVGLQTGTVSGMYDGSLAITPVPVPAGLPLLLSALGGMAFLRRRRT